MTINAEKVVNIESKLIDRDVDGIIDCINIEFFEKDKNSVIKKIKLKLFLILTIYEIKNLIFNL